MSSSSSNTSTAHLMVSHIDEMNDRLFFFFLKHFGSGCSYVRMYVRSSDQAVASI